MCVGEAESTSMSVAGTGCSDRTRFRASVSAAPRGTAAAESDFKVESCTAAAASTSPVSLGHASGLKVAHGVAVTMIDDRRWYRGCLLQDPTSWARL